MISVLIPFKNEAQSLPVLTTKLATQLRALGEPYEVLLIDNGSTDGGTTGLELPDEHFHTLRLRRGDKGRALRRGIEKSTGEVIVCMDADLEDDPADLPKFWAQISAGYEFVNGHRRNRRHEWHRVLPSFIGNHLLLHTFLSSKFHDINCGFKMFRRSCLDDVVMYGDNFRFLPLVVEKLGYRTTEVVVHHSHRIYGTSKYGFWNRLTVFADILTAYFIFRFSQKPLHFFGTIGLSALIPGVLITLWLTLERLFTGVLLKERPLLLGGIFLIVVGLQIIMTGIIGELIVFNSKKIEQEMEE